MFDLDRFTADCRAGRAADRSSKTIREVVKRAVSDPTGLLKSLGEPRRAGIKEIYRSSDLSILSVVWAPRMMIMPHNHHMWAVIGVYCGREDNIFWRRIAEAGEGQLEAAGARSLAVKDVQPFGDDIIHSVTNPTSKFTAALHVYGGDFFAAHRSEWDATFHVDHSAGADHRCTRRIPPCRHRAELEDTRQLYLAAIAEHPSCMRRLSISGVQTQGSWTRV